MASPPTLTWTTAATATPLTGSPFGVSAGTSVSRFLGVYQDVSGNGAYYSNGSNNGESTVNQEEFDYTGTTMCYKWRAQSGGVAFRIYVDGQSVDPNDASITPTGVTVSNGVLYRLQIAFGASGTRRIRIESIATASAGWEIESTGRISPSPRALDTCVVYGDSWVGGALSSGLFDVWPRTFGRMMNWEIINCGQGSTGYVQDAAAGFTARDPYANTARINNAAAVRPEWAVIFGSINDNSQDANAVQAAAASCYSQWATASPDTKLIVIGTQPLHTATPAGSLASSARQKIAALAASNVLGFIDPIAGLTYYPGGRVRGDGVNWIRGVSWSTVISDNGESAMYIGSDNTHPTQAGHDYIARKAAAEVAQVIATA